MCFEGGIYTKQLVKAISINLILLRLLTGPAGILSIGGWELDFSYTESPLDFAQYHR